MSDQVQFVRPQFVRKRYSVTGKTLSRWVANPELGFPAPIFINRVRSWSLADLQAWERARAAGRTVKETDYATA
jgi:hypothetical protein